jgi:pilus assembly protein CpaC
MASKFSLSRRTCGLAASLLLSVSAFSTDAAAGSVNVAINRADLVSFEKDMAEVIVANPEIADVRNHGKNKLSIIGKKMGKTTVRAFDAQGDLIGTYDVTVGYDIPAIRKALKQFIPNENIGVETVNTNIALTGQVSSAESVDKALKIAKEFLKMSGNATTTSSSLSPTGASTENDSDGGLLNLLQVTTGQQVMLRVRVGEINRGALKRLGVEWSTVGSPGNFFYQLAKDTGQRGLAAGATGNFVLDTLESTSVISGGYTNGSTRIAGLLKALEQDDLFKLLAEPNLIAVSGQEAEFLAGGEIPVPVPQSSTGSSTQVTIQYKPFGVAVKFKPTVLAENRLRIEVQPEVSELDSSVAVTVSGFSIPGLTTRRAKTTVEMAPGESFMIAGLIKDQSRSTVKNMPGVKEIPVLGALFRSTDFQRNETELVIAVTPYLVDPVRSADIKLPSDNFAPASQMDMIFYGALGTLSDGALTRSQTPALEGPAGFMVD